AGSCAAGDPATGTPPRWAMALASRVATAASEATWASVRANPNPPTATMTVDTVEVKTVSSSGRIVNQVTRPTKPVAMVMTSADWVGDRKPKATTAATSVLTTPSHAAGYHLNPRILTPFTRPFVQAGPRWPCPAASPASAGGTSARWPRP